MPYSTWLDIADYSRFECIYETHRSFLQIAGTGVYLPPGWTVDEGCHLDRFWNERR